MTTFDFGRYGADIVLDSTNFNKGIRDAEDKINSFDKKTSSFSSTVNKVALGALGGLTAALGAVAIKGIQGNSELEQYRQTLNTVMGDSVKAGETLDWVKQYAAKTPFEIPELVESTVKLQAMGLEAKKFLPLAGDMAAVFKSSGKTVGDAAEAINDAMMGEFERLKEFGIKLQQTDFKEGGKYAGKTYAEAIEAEFKSHNYAGAADALSSTFSGRLSTLKDTIGTFIQQVTGPLFTSLSEKMGQLMEKINVLQENGTLQKWADTATAAITGFVNGIVTVGKVVLEIGKAIYDNWSLIEPIIIGVAAGFVAFQAITGVVALIKAVTAAQAAWNGVTAAWNALMAANPIGLAAVAIGVLVVAAIALYKNWDTVSKFLKDSWNAIKETATVVFGAVGKFFSDIWQSISTATTKAWNGIATFFSDMWQSIKASVMKVWDGIKEYFSFVWKAIVWIFKNMTLPGILISHWDAISSTVVNVWNGIKNFLSGLWDEVVSIATTVFDSLAGSIKDIWNGVVSFFENLGGTFYEIGKSIFTSLWDGLKNIWSSISSFISDKINWLKDKLNIFGKAKSTAANSDTSSLGVEFPSYDVGTRYVPSDQLALIHEGEAVIPKKFNPFAGNGNVTGNSANELNQTNHFNVTMNVTANNEFDLEKSAKKVAKLVIGEVQKATKQTGSGFTFAR